MKKTLICSLHFESNCFVGNRLDISKAVPFNEGGVLDADKVQNNNQVQLHVPPQDQAVREPQALPLDHSYGVRPEPEPQCVRVEEEVQPRDTDNTVRHNVVNNNINADILQNELQKLKEENLRLKKSNGYLKRKQSDMKDKVGQLNQKISELDRKFEVSHTLVESLNQCMSEVPRQLFEETSKRARKIRTKVYHPAIRKFALTLHLCSAKAYRYNIHSFIMSKLYSVQPVSSQIFLYIFPF